MDPATRRLAVFAGVIGGALLLLVGVWSFTGHRHNGVPVIEADSRPLRVKPANPGGMQVDGANDTILSGGAEGKQTTGPLPETPAPQALKAEQQAAIPQPAAIVPPAPPVVAPLDPGPATAPVASAPVSPPAARTELPPPRPRVAIRPATVPPPVATSHAASSGLASNAALVQLAALSSEDAAMTEWQRLSHKYPDLLGGRRPTIMKTEHGGKTFWRLRTGGFGDVAQAAVFCERVKAKGAGCSIASF